MNDHSLKNVLVDASMLDVFTTPVPEPTTPCRPTLTVVMDVDSRAVVASWIGFALAEVTMA